MSSEISFEEDYQELYEYAPCGYLSSLLDGTIVGVNRTFLLWTGYSRAELLASKKQHDLITVPARIFYETQFAPLLQMQGFVKEVALDLICKERPPLPVLVNSTLMPPHDGRPGFVRSIYFDATDRRKYEKDLLSARHDLEERVKIRTAELENEIQERKKAEQDLKNLTSNILKLQDDDRRKIARELHDSLGQLLAAMSMDIGALSRESHTLPAPAAQRLSQLTELTQEALQEVRVVSYLLHPPLLDESGLAQALRTYIDGYSSRGDIAVALHADQEFGRLDQDLETGLFRIVQETLTNIHRHSQSKTAIIRIVRDKDQVSVEVQDFGKGMSPNVPQGVGLRGMRERVFQLGGKLGIESSAQGTTIRVVVPLRPPNKNILPAV